MKVVVLAEDVVIDDFLRVAGEVITVDDNFPLRGIRRVLRVIRRRTNAAGGGRQQNAVLK